MSENKPISKERSKDKQVEQIAITPHSIEAEQAVLAENSAKLIANSIKAA